MRGAAGRCHWTRTCRLLFHVGQLYGFLACKVKKPTRPDISSQNEAWLPLFEAMRPHTFPRARPDLSDAGGATLIADARTDGSLKLSGALRFQLFCIRARYVFFSCHVPPSALFSRRRESRCRNFHSCPRRSGRGRHTRVGAAFMCRSRSCRRRRWRVANFLVHSTWRRRMADRRRASSTYGGRRRVR